MSATNTPAKPKTPAQTAKPLGTASNKATSSVAPSIAPSISSDDPAKAIKELDVKTKAVNANNIARVANSQLTSNDAKLQPLMSLKTGRQIEKFPATSKDIERLNMTSVDAMLNALDAERSGSEAQKKERFRVQIGLKANPA